MKTDLLTYFMNIVLIGLKAKNSAFYFPMTSDILRLTFSLISCARVAMKPFPTATCFHETDILKVFAHSLFFVFCFPSSPVFSVSCPLCPLFSPWPQLYHDQT